MRLFFGCLATLIMVLMLVIGCSTVDADECWPNTSGGFGGSGTIPIGAGVGATTTSGDFIRPPPRGPLNASGTDNPCVTPEASTFVDFKPSEFPFVTTIPDDGTGKGGGWQVAKVNLKFEHVVVRIPVTVVTWYCDFTIEMPLRNQAMGKISASRAADLSVEITKGVAKDMKYDLPQGIFCFKFVEGLKVAFPDKYPKLGARVN